jgi:hypothetical protein
MNTQSLHGNSSRGISILPGVAEAQLNRLYFCDIIVFIILQFIFSEVALY